MIFGTFHNVCMTNVHVRLLWRLLKSWGLLNNTHALVNMFVYWLSELSKRSGLVRFEAPLIADRIYLRYGQYHTAIVAHRVYLQCPQSLLKTDNFRLPEIFPVMLCTWTLFSPWRRALVHDPCSYRPITARLRQIKSSRREIKTNKRFSPAS